MQGRGKGHLVSVVFEFDHVIFIRFVWTKKYAKIFSIENGLKNYGLV